MNNENTETIDTKHVLYPPGGLLIWGVVVMELLTFGVALIAFAVSSKGDPAMFSESRAMLNPLYGVVNTVFLLTSGFFMAQSVGCFKVGDRDRAKRYLLLAMLGGVLFVVLKAVEYQQKLSLGLTLDYNTFFTYYWLLTSFHVMHVLVGLIILSFVLCKLRKPDVELKLEDYEAGAAFWHMCDLIWLILFPAIYLIF